MVHMNRRQVLRYGSDCYFTFNASAGLLDEGGEKLACIPHAHGRIFLGQTDAAAPFGTPFKELAHSQWSDRGLFLCGADGVSTTHRMDRIEIYCKRRVEGVVCLVGVFDAGNAKIGSSGAVCART